MDIGCYLFILIIQNIQNIQYIQNIYKMNYGHCINNKIKSDVLKCFECFQMFVIVVKFVYFVYGISRPETIYLYTFYLFIHVWIRDVQTKRLDETF